MYFFSILCETGAAAIKSQAGYVRVTVNNTHRGVSQDMFRYVVSNNSLCAMFCGILCNNVSVFYEKLALLYIYLPNLIKK